MRVLTFTTLFPNPQQPILGIFVKNRALAVSSFDDVDLKVVAPVPFFPRLDFLKQWHTFSRWYTFSLIAKTERSGPLWVNHPRYFITPKIGMPFYGLWLFLSSLPSLTRLFKEWPFDVIDAHFLYPDGLSAVLAGQFFKRPVVVSARGTDAIVYPRFKLIEPQLHYTIRSATALICVSDAIRSIVCSLGASDRKTRTIPNGIDPRSFYAVDRMKAKQMLGQSRDQKMLVSIGTLTREKGIDLLIEALSLLKSEDKLHFMTYIIGEGEERVDLRKEIFENHLTNDIELIGLVSHAALLPWYNAADLLYFGCSIVGNPNVVRESLACGTPVLATRAAGINEIITAPDYGLIVERDKRSIADGLLKAFAVRWHRNRLAQGDQLRTWQTVAGEVHDVFSSAISGYPHKRRQALPEK